MSEKELADYSRAELMEALETRREMEAKEEMHGDLKYNFGISNEDFADLIERYNDIDWETIADYPWFVIYEYPERFVTGQSKPDKDEVELLIDELVRSDSEILYVLKEGKMLDFSINIAIDIKV